MAGTKAISWRLRGLVTLAVSLAVSATQARADVGRLQAATAPAPGAAESIGGYSRGCVRGAKALALRGRNHKVAKPRRRRHFGHPDLIQFVGELAAAMKSARLGRLMVGDLSQPRGGPAKSGHASHQSGLDVDLWYLPGARRVVSRRGETVNKYWRRSIEKVLALAARDQRVARIFVNPVIKRHLCRRAGKRPWLQKLRPWWGHDNHFHVRLECPTGSDACEPQAPIKAGDGCAEVEWWFSDEAKAERRERRERYRSKVAAKPELPEKCLELSRD